MARRPRRRPKRKRFCSEDEQEHKVPYAFTSSYTDWIIISIICIAMVGVLIYHYSQVEIEDTQTICTFPLKTELIIDNLNNQSNLPFRASWYDASGNYIGECVLTPTITQEGSKIYSLSLDTAELVKVYQERCINATH